MLIVLSHLDVYAIADLTQHNGLKAAVEKQFASLVRDNYKEDDICSVISKVYEVAPPGAHGNELRAIMTRIIAYHASEIFKAHPEFKITFENLPAFSIDLAFALSGAHPDYDPRFIMRRKLCCHYCDEDWYSEVVDDEIKQYCPECKDDLGDRAALVKLEDIEMIVHLYTCPEKHRFMCAGRHLGLIRCILCNAVVTKIEEVRRRD